MTSIFDNIPEFGRHRDLLDTNLMATQNILCVGVGGVIGTVEDLAASGCSNFAFVDHDHVEEENVGTGRFTCYEVGRWKSEVAVSRVQAVNPSASALSYRCRHDQLKPAVADFLWKNATFVLSMTDDVRVQAELNKLAIKYGKPILHGGVALDSSRFEIGATIPGQPYCFRCYPGVSERIDAAKGRKGPPRSVPSNRLISNRINGAILDLTVGLIHHLAGSTLPIARYGQEFMEASMMIGPIDLDWQAGQGQVFGHVGSSDRIHATRLARPFRPKGWTCPDCGAVH